MDAGSFMRAYILRFAIWVLVVISTILIVLIGLRALDFQDFPTYMQDMVGIVICTVFAFVVGELARSLAIRSLNPWYINLHRMRALFQLQAPPRECPVVVRTREPD